MQIATWLQSFSLIIVAFALLISIRQNREIARQTREIANQTVALQRSLEQNSYQEANVAHDAQRMTFFKDDAGMLRWYLSTRGYLTSTRKRNRKALYLIIKIEIHEGNYLNHENGTLTDAMWDAWLEVLKADIRIPDFKLIWPNAKRFLAKSFTDFVDNLLAAHYRRMDM